MIIIYALKPPRPTGSPPKEGNYIGHSPLSEGWSKTGVFIINKT
jgi:hypothetical protein